MMNELQYRHFFPYPIKITFARKRVIEAMVANDDPKGMDAMDVYKSMLQEDKPVGMGSIYRILAELHKIEKADRIYDRNGTMRYRLRDERSRGVIRIVPRSGNLQVLKDPDLLEQVGKALSQIGVKLSPMETVTIRLG